MLDLDGLRKKHRLFEQATAFLRQYPDSVFHDQDALNRLFQLDYLQLDSKFNKIVSRSEMEEMQQPAVWHFAGLKPWLYYASAMDMLYWKALALTPWQNTILDGLAAAFARSQNKMFEQMHNDNLAIKALEVKLSVALGKATLGASQQGLPDSG